MRLTVCMLAPITILATVARLGAQDIPPIADTLRDQVSRQGLLVWSSTDPVDWSDFRGPERVVTMEAAQILSGVTYLVQCLDTVLTYSVLATFDPSISWVRSDILTDSVAGRRSLQHERTHFNITEVAARRVRRALAAVAGACPGHEDRAAEVFQQIVTAEGLRVHERYDEETRHGMRPVVQRTWDQRTVSQLDSLAAFSNPTRTE